MSSPLVIISDTHGCYNTMVRLLNQVAVSHPGAQLVFLGDLIDRGPHSRKVVEFAMENTIPTTKGNHEDLCLAYTPHVKRGFKAMCAREYDYNIWIHNGGDYALGNWPHVREDGIREGERIPDEVLNWMQALPSYLIFDTVDDTGRKLLASHTGYGLSADLGTRDGWLRALWGRHAYGDGEFPEDGYYRVFGHSQEKEAVVTEKWAMIDSGAAYVKRGLGNMTAFVWPSKQLIVQGFDESPTEQRFQMVDGQIVP